MTTSILLVDSYDSFTYNLHHMLKNKVSKIDVVKNDQIDINEVIHYDKILISPGPGVPEDAGIIKDVIRYYKDSKPILGVCLGLQAIAEVFGGKLKNLDTVYHGVSTHVEILKKDNLFHNIPKVFEAGRYHSWTMDQSVIPNDIEIIARDERDEIMALRIKDLNIKGVQFHPESILTVCGERILDNWLAS